MSLYLQKVLAAETAIMTLLRMDVFVPNVQAAAAAAMEQLLVGRLPAETPEAEHRKSSSSSSGSGSGSGDLRPALPLSPLVVESASLSDCLLFATEVLTVAPPSWLSLPPEFVLAGFSVSLPLLLSACAELDALSATQSGEDAQPPVTKKERTTAGAFAATVRPTLDASAQARLAGFLVRRGPTAQAKVPPLTVRALYWSCAGRFPSSSAAHSNGPSRSVLLHLYISIYLCLYLSIYPYLSVSISYRSTLNDIPNNTRPALFLLTVVTLNNPDSGPLSDSSKPSRYLRWKRPSALAPMATGLGLAVV